MFDKFDMSLEFFMSDKFDMPDRCGMSDRLGMSGRGDMSDRLVMSDGLTGTIHLKVFTDWIETTTLTSNNQKITEVMHLARWCKVHH